MPAYVSRRTQSLLNPIPWALLLLVGLVILFWQTLPSVSAWYHQSRGIAELSSNILTLQEQNDALETTLSDTEKRFQTVAADTIAYENHRLPVAIPTDQIVQQYELLCQALDTIDTPERDSSCNLRRLSFTTSKPHESLPVESRTALLTIEMDEPSLRDLLTYTEQNRLPPQLQAAYSAGVIRQAEWALLTTTMPIAQVQQLQYEEINRQPGIYDVRLQIAFFQEKHLSPQ